jgi:hypothetical protein
MVDTYYEAALVDFKALNDHEYDKEHESSQEELGAVKAIDNKNICACKPYGTVASNPNDHPLHARSSTLMFWEKQYPTTCQIN